MPRKNGADFDNIKVVENKDDVVMEPHSYYDRKDAYAEEIIPLIEELVDKCGEHNIPLVLGTCFSIDDHGDSVRFGTGNALVGKLSEMPDVMYAAFLMMDRRTPMAGMISSLILASSRHVSEEENEETGQQPNG